MLDAELPFLTCYYRIIDRINMIPLTEYKDAYNNTDVYNYGTINVLHGGLSQYIVEFNIWNNEPRVSAGWIQKVTKPAENCTLSAWLNETNSIDINYRLSNNLFSDNMPFLQIRCISNNTIRPWETMRLTEKFTNIYGHKYVNKKGLLDGLGDHAIIQTGICIPRQKNLFINENTDMKFCLHFECEYDKNNVVTTIL